MQAKKAHGTGSGVRFMRKMLRIARDPRRERPGDGHLPRDQPIPGTPAVDLHSVLSGPERLRQMKSYRFRRFQQTIFFLSSYVYIDHVVEKL
jgi:hypothetical protein